MKKTEALVRVKEAELEVKKMKDRATSERDRILKEARREVLKIQDESRHTAENALKLRIDTGKKDIDSKRSKILKQGQQEAEAIRKRGMLKMDEAASLLLKRFEEGVVAVSTERDV
ncbi:MAG: hypothetical protein JSV43_00755 [Methanobacteriota archaeon]|nr:MAG: hypothetical protein JSV43_00755 [Euryarchaeota archaeon]